MGIAVEHARGSGRALVARRESDGRYAIVEADVELELALEPQAGELELAELLAKAERDCFIGASLTVKPTYHWTTV